MFRVGERHPGASNSVHRTVLGCLVKEKSDLFREAPERRSRGDEWNSRETDFRLMKGRRLEQPGLSFPTVGSAALVTVNLQRVNGEKHRSHSLPTSSHAMAPLHFLHSTSQLELSRLITG